MLVADGYLTLVQERYDLLEEKEQRELELDEAESDKWEPDEDSFKDR